MICWEHKQKTAVVCCCLSLILIVLFQHFLGHQDGLYYAMLCQSFLGVLDCKGIHGHLIISHIYPCMALLKVLCFFSQGEILRPGRCWCYVFLVFLDSSNSLPSP